MYEWIYDKPIIFIFLYTDAMEKNKFRLLENLVDDFIRNLRAFIFYVFLILFGCLCTIVFMGNKAGEVKKDPEKRIVVIVAPDILQECGSVK